MTTARLLRCLFASLISIGLALTPLAAPAAAGRDASVAGMMSAEDTSADMANEQNE
jgi:hypothetical protein